MGTILGIFDFESFRRLPWNTFFGNDFGLFWIFEKFLIFLKIFEDSTLHGTLGKSFFSKKTPENMFKTRLDTFGNDFGHFWIFENFLIFLKIFEDSKKTPQKHVQNPFGHFWERFWAFLEF